MDRANVKGANAEDHRDLTPPYARFVAPLIRPFPNFDLFFAKSLRQRAIEKLRLQPGDRVLDAGCGPGGSFPYLAEAVSASGAVVGIEISPAMAEQANKRIQKNGWTNIQVVLADAREVELEGHFDALLMMGAPDVYASPAALARLVPHLRQNARVVAFGAKLCRHRQGRAFNSIFRGMFARATFASTPALDYEPWKELEQWTDRMEIEEHFLGWMFLAWGSVRPDKAAHTGESRRRAADPHPR